MRRPIPRRLLIALSALLLVSACSHPIDIVGEGDVVSASGERDCTKAQLEVGAESCTENLVVGRYDETYTAVPAEGWHFHRWANYCGDRGGDTCSFGVPADVVEKAYGQTAPPLVAIFRPDVITGFDSLFIGHSFFRPFADAMGFHGPNAGFTEHEQEVVFAGGSKGAPEALWNDRTKRAQIQAVLDRGDVDLFGMTYHPAYPGLDGYRRWIDDALGHNPDTRFFIAMPWLTDPASMDAQTYSQVWHAAHRALSHGAIDTLREEYPGVDIFGIPYGQAAVELYERYDAGQLPDVASLIGEPGTAIFRDDLGHAGDILEELGARVWLRAIYDVSLDDYDHNPGYDIDLVELADQIMDEHDPAYDRP